MVFYKALFEGKLVSESSLEQMKKMVDNYGMGLFQMPFYDKKSYGHSGGIDGFSSFIGYFPSDNVSIAFTYNAMAMNGNDISIGALSIFYGMEYKLPEFKPALELSSKDLDIYLGTYSGSDFLFKEIVITKEDNILIGQPAGQEAIPLEAYEKDKFKIDVYGVKLDFLTEERKLIFKMGGEEHVLTKVE